MQRLLKFLPILILPVLAGCSTDTVCFEWRCPLSVQDMPKYEAFLDTQDRETLEFGQKEYRYRLIQWIGENRYAEAKKGDTKADYDKFLTYYESVGAEAGATLAVYAEIALAKSSGNTTTAPEPKPIFSKDDFIPKILPIPLLETDAQITIASNPIITDDNSLKTTPTEAAASATFIPATDSLLNRSITKFTEDHTGIDASEKDLKALIQTSAKLGDFGTAFEGLMNFANRENPHAQYLVGRMYEDGVGIDQNYTVAIEWLEKSSNLNWADAQGALLEMYEVGLGTPTDAKGLVDWHMRAAKLGHPAAQTQTGIYFENGEGVQKSLNEAAKWYRRAATQGNPNAQFLLGWMYAEGQGVELDFIEAYTWFYLADSQGLGDANRLMQMVLGEMTAEQIKSAQQRIDQRTLNQQG